MAGGKKIIELDETMTIGDAHYIPVTDGTDTKKVSYSTIKQDFTKIDTRSQPMHTVRVGRLLDRFGYEQTERKLYAQGTCVHDGVYYAIGAYNSNANQNLTAVAANGAIVSSKTFTELGHANGIDTDGENFIIASGVAPRLHIVDFVEWEYVRRITFEDFTTIFSVSVFDGNIYFLGRDASNLYVCLLSDTTETATYDIVCTIPDVGFIGTRQNFCVYNGYAYLLYAYSGYVYKIKLETGELVCSYYMKDFYGELEDIFVLNGALTISAPYHLSATYERACFVNLIQTDILGPVKSYERQMDTHDNLTLRVTGNAETVINPTDNFNTFEEACFLLNKNHGGTLRVSNTSRGAIILFDGVYNIIPVSGGYTAEVLYTSNAVVTARQLTYTTGFIYTSRLSCVSVHFGGASTFNISEVSCVSCSFDSGAAFSTTRSQFVFDAVAVVTEFAASISQAVGATARINSKYVAGIMNLAKLNRYLTVIRIANATVDLKCMATTTNFNANEYTLSTNDSTYPYVHFLSGSVYLVDTNGDETELDSNAIIEVH